ncbi:hypothetical protein BLS_001724 [Venturia inaequalis]|uniref:Ubiquitin-like domain-containing protein n=1 Tax=Venturia inaequalis TaxID=5025 RepID=A0A8H3U3B2_VENIN|nr:hypothetical protein EG328_000404 [Venturia inaequalis]KAE9977014.1 hypothetical protein BLS_001724 [Venturia inaequalis]KAE9987834.1 hypothetical protein EG327_003625 [Venturia inaequalis]
MDQPQASIERAKSATIEPEHLPNMATENGSREDVTPSAPTDNLTSQQLLHPLPPNPFLQQPRVDNETEQHTAEPTRTMNATPPPTAISNAVAVIVRDSHGSEVTFKIKKHTKLNKLMNAFCERQGKSPTQLRFFFDGTRITGEDTPESLDMENVESIDVYEEQIGGGR